MKKLLTALLSLFIVMQCVFSPMASALEPIAEEEMPELYTEGGETVEETEGETKEQLAERFEEILTVQEQENYALAYGAGYYNRATIAYGRPTMGEEGTPEGTTGRRFAVEGTDSNLSKDQTMTVEWEEVPPGSGNFEIVSSDLGMIKMPTDDEIGRVPDMEFERWYVYGGIGPLDADETKRDGTNDLSPGTWTRDENRDTSADIPIADLVENGTAEWSEDGSTLLVDEDTASELLENLINLYKASDGTVLDPSNWGSYKKNGLFPLVGGWKASSTASATDVGFVGTNTEGEESTVALYAYGEGVTQLPPDELTAKPFDPTAASQEYYLRVGEDVETVSLDLTAFEPYLAFQREYSELVPDGSEEDGITHIIEYSKYRDVALTAETASPISITINGENAVAAAESATYSLINDGRYYEQHRVGETTIDVRGWESANSLTAPARSNWKCLNIPIEKSNDQRACNEIAITITAPDGVTTATYTFYIQRVKSPTVTLRAGNTPAGVIARDPDSGWVGTNNDPAGNKQDWLDYFKIDRKMRHTRNSTLNIHGGVYHPQDTSHSYDLNNGGVLFYDGWFNKGAWGRGDDLDLDPEAIVVYQNYQSRVPGFDISTSNGTIYSGELKRRIALNTPKTNPLSSSGELYTLLDALFPTQDTSTNYETAYYYEVGGKSELRAPSAANDGWQTIDTETMSIDLRDLYVLPGAYTIEYIFTDPYTGQELKFTRPLVVLAIPGDVDMDGATTVADAAALRYLVSGDKLAEEKMTDAQKLFAWRVCNVNRDTVVNAYDYGALYAGFRPQIRTMRVLEGKNPMGVSDYFYIPLSSFDGRYERNDNEGSGSATLEAEYTGKQMTEIEEGGEGGEVTSSVVESVTPNTISTQDGIQRGDVFWVEVNFGALGKGYEKISSLTGTLSYDSRYIRPATLEDMEGLATIDELDTNNETLYTQLCLDTWKSSDGETHTWASWAALVNKYNLRTGADTVFAGTGRFELNLASRPANDYATHFSKTITKFEELIKAETGGTGALKDVVFSVKLSASDKTSADLSNGGTIVRMPFYMHTFPTQHAGGTMPLVSLDFGMQDLEMVNDGERLFNLDLSIHYSGLLTTSAFSAQDEIYGNLTRNLRDDIGYSTEPLYIKIASDNTPRELLINQATGSVGQNAKYGRFFKHHRDAFFEKSVTDGELPPGLELDNAGNIQGTPSQAGEYLFKIGDGYYKIVVEKQPLRVWPVAVSSYYGEGDYSGEQDYSEIFNTGTNSGRYVYDTQKLAYSLRYAYNPNDLIKGNGSFGSANFTFDASRANDKHPNDGNMENLAWLLTRGGEVKDCVFVNPKLSTTRTAHSNVGKYSITVDIGAEGSGFYAELQNYYFVLDTSKTAAVTVVERPFVVDDLNFEDESTAAAVGKIAMPKIVDTDDPLRPRATAQLGENMHQFNVSVAKEGNPQPALDGSGRVIYHGLPISGKGLAFDDDLIEITYTPTFVVTQSDTENRIRPKNFFVKENSTETRDISISAISLTGGKSRANYFLVGDQQQAITEKNAGYVANVALEALVIEKNWADLPLEVNYGESIEIIGRLIANLRFGENNTVQVEYTTPEGFASRHLYVSLVTVGQAEAEKALLADGKTIYFGGSASSSVRPTDTTFNKNGENGIVMPCFTNSARIPATENDYCIRVAYMPDTTTGIVYKAEYSAPITINKRTITLRVPEETHYYGELPEVDYSFNIQDLAPWDRTKISDSPTVENGVGTPDDLARALGYANEAAWSGRPTIAAIDNGRTVPTTLDEFKDEKKQLTRNSQVTGIDFYIGLYGAKHDNYKFNYEQIRRGGSLTISDEFGMNFGRIEQRPIVVNKLPDSKLLGSIYADFYADKPENLLLRDMKFGTDDGVIFSLPTHDAEKTSYWLTGNENEAIKINMGLSGNALVNGDKLSVVCVLRLLNETTQWSSIADGYFNMKDGSGNTLAEKNVLASVKEMRLSSSDTAARNYRLVYASQGDALSVRPQEVEYYSRVQSGSTITYEKLENTSGAKNIQYVVGEVKVTTRRMTAVEIIGAPRATTKIHGDEFIPDGLTVRITFETGNGSIYNKDIDLAAQPLDGMKLSAGNIGELVYNSATFARYGLGVALAKGSATVPFVGANGNCVTHTGHDGAYIVVSGKRCASHSTVTSAAKSFTITVKKKPLTLTAVDQYRYYGEKNYSTRFVECVSSGGVLTAPNAAYEYCFDISQLAAHEQSTVPAASKKTIDGREYGYGYVRCSDSGMKATQNGALAALGNYDAPTFSTAATASSSVVDGGRGGYALNLSGGSMANYELQYASGRIYVFRRPIAITRFYAGYTGIDDTDRSIYTLLTGTSGTVATRVLPYYDADYKAVAGTNFSGYTQSGSTISEVASLPNSDIQPNYSGGAINGWHWFGLQNGNGGNEGNVRPDGDAAISIVPDYARNTFFILRDGIIGDDNLAVSFTVSYGAVSEEMQKTPAHISVSDNAKVELVDNGSGAYANYILQEYTGTTHDLLPARVELRKIADIMVQHLPTKDLGEYTYSEPLDLRGLQLQVTYEGGSTRLVSYADDLSQYGIYISYYDYATAPPEPTEGMTDAQREAAIAEQAKVLSECRRANGGDHLTIAPMHDTRDTLKDYNKFSQNGKYLIITAQRGSGQPYVQRMISSTTGEPSKDDPGVPIVIKPLEIEYEVTASDKTYDGTTQAVGSITFTNIYSGDLIYAVTGSSYEGNWTWADRGNAGYSNQYNSLVAAIGANGYRFSSGSVGAGTNSRLQFTDSRGWGKGTLTFEFADENVRYQDDAYNTVKTSGGDGWDDWSADVAPMKLSVRDIILGGPDAKNYTFASDKSWQTTTSVALDADNAPSATIDKASRAPLGKDTVGVMPTLEVDESTGVVRLCYHGETVGDKVKNLSVLENRNRVTHNGTLSYNNLDLTDDYADELHLEFALEYLVKDDNVIRYYCGDRDSFWDTFYFGGETVTSVYPNGAESEFYPNGYVSEETDPGDFSGEMIGQEYKWTNVDARINPDAVYRHESTDEDGNSVINEYKLIQYLDTDESGNMTARDSVWELDDGLKFHVRDINNEAKSTTINGETYYYFYGYYTTERSAIPRGAYVVGKVRLAETHNYLASDPFYTSEEYKGESTSDAKRTELKAKTDAAMQAYVGYTKQPSEGDSAATLPSDMLRMFSYRIELVSAKDMQSAKEDDEKTYDVRTLRSVRFTDCTGFVEQSELSGAIGDSETHYYAGFYWDDRYQNALEFSDDDPIMLGVEITLEVTREVDGESVTALEKFNSGNNIQLFVTQGGNDYNPIERWIRIHPREITARVGETPIKLEVEFYPSRVANMEIVWESSDERIVKVSADGVLEFVGVGMAIISATSHFGRVSIMTVTVLEAYPEQTGVFNHETLAAYLGVDSDYFFYPDREMTRGEFVCVAAMFFLANDSWGRFGSGEFVDLVGDEPYAEAVKLLGEWGVINGVGEEQFAGERIASRAEAAAIIARMLGIDPSKFIGKDGFADSGIHSTWASGYINGLKAKGVVVGDGGDFFQPDRGITRAETAAMFYRLVNYRNAYPVTVYPRDVPMNHWAYSAILRAVNESEPVFEDGTDRSASKQKDDEK